MRDITLGDTFYHHFTTRSFSTGVPTTLLGTPVLSVLEENNATPITAGVSVSVDRASVTGLNEATIVATSGNGYESGKTYAIYISTGTVGGVSVVGEVVGEFTIQASAAAVDLANGTDGLGAIKADTAAILTDTAEIGVAGAGLTNINLPDQTMNITGNITGNLSGSIGSLGATAKTDVSTAVLTTQMTESYAANGVAPTLAQAQFAMHQMLMQFGISGTSLTVRKLDDSTTAFIVTLDSATSPTDAKRV